MQERRQTTYDEELKADLEERDVVELVDCAQGGVDVSLVRRVPGANTTGLTVILHHELWRNILTYSGTIAETSWDDLDLNYLSDSRHFHFSSYYLQRALRPRVGELFQQLKAKGLTISLDTNDDPDDRWEGGLSDVLRYVDVFLPNEREACKAAGKTCDITIYPDTPHGFNADYRPSYRAEQAKEGWAKMLACENSSRPVSPQRTMGASTCPARAARRAA